MPLAIHATALSKQYRGRTVLDGIDLEVERGEIFALLGANGAGKTTTISILTTLVRPDGGTAAVAGHDVVVSPEEVRRRISLTGQSAAVDDMLTASENLTMFARLGGLGIRSARARAAELLESLDLEEAANRRVGTFSGGMRRRLDLALSLIVAPEVLFLDEPTTGLDTRSRRTLWHLIRSLADAGTTVFLTTQYLEEADELADRIAVLDSGRIVGLGTPAQLKARIGGTSVEVENADGALLLSLPTDGTIAGIRAALDSIGLVEGALHLRTPSLDDVFLALTGDPSSARTTPLTSSRKESA
ncbi:ATP-binding cassette domain-containing protein [Microbacterium esteraromaticum]|uniref:ATP-binding cassette domain-containing protein n=1 Tax=Microbacterium esteraromaticum TaxID=57043 RepID=A0A7D7WAJ4_9MICO|nr:ATP-binding cassette domain-containing protein [Microbacterium esteraromaticum]QMU97298.1 ATP-binding cassette domain-containing protein [Microbacterium esteraromaticum]